MRGKYTFELFQDHKDPTTFVFLSTWKNDCLKKAPGLQAPE
jgi:quinol monooxygenase YgiN